MEKDWKIGYEAVAKITPQMYRYACDSQNSPVLVEVSELMLARDERNAISKPAIGAKYHAATFSVVTS